MREDWQRDNWVESNTPKNQQQFSRDFVMHLMKEAYEEGRNRQDRYKENEKYRDHDL